jgi:hypothetical protein
VQQQQFHKNQTMAVQQIKPKENYFRAQTAQLIF